MPGYPVTDRYYRGHTANLQGASTGLWWCPRTDDSGYVMESLTNPGVVTGVSARAIGTTFHECFCLQPDPDDLPNHSLGGRLTDSDRELIRKHRESLSAG